MKIIFLLSFLLFPGLAESKEFFGWEIQITVSENDKDIKPKVIKKDGSVDYQFGDLIINSTGDISNLKNGDKFSIKSTKMNYGIPCAVDIFDPEPLSVQDKIQVKQQGSITCHNREYKYSHNNLCVSKINQNNISTQYIFLNNNTITLMIGCFKK